MSLAGGLIFALAAGVPLRDRKARRHAPRRGVAGRFLFGSLKQTVRVCALSGAIPAFATGAGIKIGIIGAQFCAR